MQKERYSTNTAGISLVEVLLSSALFALILTALVGAWLYGQEATALAGSRARAVMLAEEGLEAARSIRDSDFANISAGTYGLAESGGVWTLSGSSDSVGVFTRTIEVESVDADRFDVTSTITWQQNAQRTGVVSATTRLTNWQKSVETGPSECTGPPECG